MFGTGNSQFNRPGGIGIDKNDNVYVSDTAGGSNEISRVQKFDSVGNFLGVWGERYYLILPWSIRTPGGIDFDKDGNMYLVAVFPDDSPMPTIKKFDPTLQYLLGGVGKSGHDDSDPYNFWYPGDIAVNSKGDIYVSVWGDAWPGEIYQSQIKKFDSNFKFLTRWYLDSVTGIAIDSEDNILACSVRDFEMGVYKYDPDGNLIQRIAPNGQADGEIWAPQSVAIDSEGNLYVGDLLNRIQKFAPPYIKMASFVIDHAKIDFKKKPDDDKINAKGSFLLGQGASVIPGEDVTVRIGSFSQKIQMDVKDNGKKWEYKRAKGAFGIKDMKIEWKAKEATFEIHVDDADLGDMAGWTNPVTISLKIGNDLGKQSIVMTQKKDTLTYK
jgi:DNA-binding beta-propeller fold protein YncE